MLKKLKNIFVRIILKNIPIGMYITRSPTTVTLQASYKEIVDLMENNVIRHLPVLDGKKVVGIISERNLKLPPHLANEINLKAEVIMTIDPYTIQSDTPLHKVVSVMAERRIGSVIIVSSQGELVGIFTTVDALNALNDILCGEML